MIRWRWVFVVAMVAALLAFPPGRAMRVPAQSAPTTVQVLGTSGTPGSISAPIAIANCRYASAALDYRASIEGPGFSAAQVPGHANQRIVWEPRLYQVTTTWPNDQIVRTGALQDLPATSGSVQFTATTFADLPQGPAYIAGGRLAWFSGDTELGTIEFVFRNHDSFRDTTIRFARNLAHCAQIAPATVALSTYRTTVNVTVHLTGRYFPVSAPVSVTWKGQPVAQTTSDANGNVSASIRVPATPLGEYRLGLDAGSLWKPFGTLTVAPRIKVIPDQVERGETIKISLRGFAKKESVRIRWLRDGQWIEIGWVSTSNTGSGELWIPVPAWAADGSHAVRGDGPGARAQTNVVFVSGGLPVLLASDAATPSPVEAAPATPEPTLSEVGETPTVPAATPEAEAADTPGGEAP